MFDLILLLIPLVLGLIVSPLAIMALIAMLLSKRAKRNGVAFLIGWIAAIAVTLAISFAGLSLLGVQRDSTPPLWLAYLRFVIAVVLIVLGIYLLRRGRGRAVAMAHAASPGEVINAAPQLPGWLRAVDTFTPLRSAWLGFGIFILNPVDTSCGILAMLEVRLSSVSNDQRFASIAAFAIVAILPIAIPVIVLAIRGQRAQPFLKASRRWIAGHTTLLASALLFLIAAIQLVKAFSAVLKT